MSEVHLMLSPGEREWLVGLLTTELKKKQVEVHRTEFSRDFRRQVEAEETLIRALLDRLAHTANVG